MANSTVVNPSQETTVNAVVIYRPSYRAYKILQAGFVILPLVAGIDKFFNFFVDWTIYLSPFVSNVINAYTFMKIVGVIEILAGVLAIFNPRLAGYVIAVWMWGIIVNLLTIPAYFDIALRDLGLSLGALALAALSQEYHVKPEIYKDY